MVEKGDMFIFNVGAIQGAIMAGFMAAVLAYFINDFALKIFREKAITFYAPMAEELLKTGLALFLGGNIIISHLTFGFIEGACDMYKNRRATAYLAAILGIISHCIFGILTANGIRYFKSSIIGICLTIFIHICWNLVAINQRDVNRGDGSSG